METKINYCLDYLQQNFSMCQGSLFQIPDPLLSCFMMLLPMIFMESIEKSSYHY
jgi:hypothetical protein